MTDLGSLADWVSGLASVFAAGTALFFWGKDRKDQEQSALTDVSMWTQMGEGQEERWFICSLNNTNSPIWNWSLSISWNSEGESLTEHLSSATAGLLPPGTSHFPWEPSTNTSAESAMHIVFSFEDSTGHCWQRESGKRLKRIKLIES